MLSKPIRIWIIVNPRISGSVHGDRDTQRLTVPRLTVGFRSDAESKPANPDANTGRAAEAAGRGFDLGISFPTIKQWIYKKKIRSVQTAGGHHRIPQSEVDRLLFRTRGKTEEERKQVVRRVSGRNQLVGRIDSVRISGLMAEVKISIGGQQITSIITATLRTRNAAEGRTNRRRPYQSHRSDDSAGVT